MKEYEFHEYADIFPLMGKEELNELAKDIKKNDLLEDIILFENKILDGRNRYLSCNLAKVEPKFKKYNLSIDPLDYIIAMNLIRRHLLPAQLGDIALIIMPLFKKRSRIRQLSQLRNIQKTIVPTSKVVSKEEGEALELVAKKLKTSKDTIQIAKKVKESKDPEIKKKWESTKKGETTIKAVKILIQKKENKDKPIPKLPEDKYFLIYADPPWFYKGGTTPNRIIENQYPTMETKDICKMEIPNAKDSILFMWCTNPKLEEGLQIIKAWDFIYKTNMVWVKDKIGMGYYARGRHELLLIATKGNPGVPEPKNRPNSVIEFPRTKHSKKPEIVYELIEQMYPNRKYLELFARNKRKNWKSWGNEI